MINYAIISKLTTLLIAFEGFSSCAYWDVSQYSNGHGTKAAHRYECIDQRVARDRLISHAEKDIKFIKDIYKDRKPTDNELVSLASFCYNTGPRGCEKVVKLVANGEHRAASWAMRQNIKKGSGYEEGLTIRRAKETALLLEAAEKPNFTEWIISGYDY